MEGVIGLIKFSALSIQPFKTEGAGQSLTISLSHASFFHFIVGSTFGSLSSRRSKKIVLSKSEEKQRHKIDHLPARNLIANLIVLRFANLVLEPLWSWTYIDNIQVILFPVIQKKIAQQGSYVC